MLEFDAAPLRVSFLLLEQGRQTGLAEAKVNDLDLAVAGGPAAADAGSAKRRHQFLRQTEARPGCGIVDQTPADGCLVRLCRRSKPRALLLVEDAGFLGLDGSLIEPDGIDRALVGKLAVGKALVVAGPGEVGFDSQLLDGGHGRIGFGNLRCRLRRPLVRSGGPRHRSGVRAVNVTTPCQRRHARQRQAHDDGRHPRGHGRTRRPAGA